MTYVQPATANQPLGPESIFKVVNVGHTPVDLMYDSRTWHWEPGQVQYVPFPVVALHLGDPRSVGAPSAYRDRHHAPVFIPSREQEVARLRQLYGGTFFGEQDSFIGVPYDERTKELGEPYRLPHPEMEVFDTDDNRVYTVLDDPRGERAATMTPVSAMSFDDQLAALQRQMNALLAQRNMSTEQHAPVGPPPDTDDPGVHAPYVEPEPMLRGGVPVDVEMSDADLPSDD